MTRQNEARRRKNALWSGDAQAASMFETKPGTKQQVERTFAEDLIGNVNVVALDVAGRGYCSHRFLHYERGQRFAVELPLEDNRWQPLGQR